MFDEPRLAELYDAFDSDRSDLDVYAALVDELGAESILDIGCGTGTFACLLARSGKTLVAVDPAEAMLRVARAKPGAERVRWVLADAPSLSGVTVDLVTMTGNVAQVFLTDQDWNATLEAARRALRPRGTLVFETRDPGREAWKEWTKDQSYERLELPGVGVVETWNEVTDVSLPLVSFRSTTRFHADGAVLTSHSTLRFRSKDEVVRSLEAAGFALREIRDAADRPGREHVYLARLS